LCWLDPRGENWLGVLDERRDDLSQLVDRFPRPKDDLREAAPLLAIQINGGRWKWVHVFQCIARNSG
jgi:hypothetical protein